MTDRSVDIDGIIDHQCLNFLLMISLLFVMENEMPITSNRYIYPISAPPWTNEHIAPGRLLASNTEAKIL